MKAYGFFFLLSFACLEVLSAHMGLDKCETYIFSSVFFVCWGELVYNLVLRIITSKIILNYGFTGDVCLTRQ